MPFTNRFTLTGLALICAISAGCKREEAQVPAATTQTQASRQPNTTTTVTGCLRSGAAASTYVLTTAATETGGTPATYELTGANVNLEDHVGKRVEVSGVVESQSQIATRETATPADNATGTAGKPGTPTVQTGTQLSIQRIDVKSVRATGGDCGM